MNSRLKIVSVILAALCLAMIAMADPPVPAPQTTATSDHGFLNSVDDFISGHLTIGYRPIYVHLQDSSRTPVDNNKNGQIDADELLRVSYLGSITGLQSQQDYFRSAIFARWDFWNYCGVEMTWEHIQAKTFNFWSKGTDGTFDMSGPMLAAVLQYPNESIFTPRVGAGVAFLSSTFNMDPYWHGTVVEAGIRNWLTTQNDPGYVVMGACDVDLGPAWALTFYARYMQAHIDGHYWLTYSDGTMLQDRGVTRFPMDSVAYGAGLEFRF